MNIYLNSIGCRLNQSEIETFARQFRSQGHTLVDTPSTADLVIINTCTVTADCKFGLPPENPSVCSSWSKRFSCNWMLVKPAPGRSACTARGQPSDSQSSERKLSTSDPKYPQRTIRQRTNRQAAHTRREAAYASLY